VCARQVRVSVIDSKLLHSDPLAEGVMAKQDLQKFLVALSESPSLQEQLKKDPDAVLAEHGLSDEESSLVKSGDLDGMRRYLGDVSAGIMVRVDYD
jgi:hypothetical protein